MKTLVLDTSAFVWFLEGNPKLPAEVRAAMEDPAVEMYLPSMAIAELVDLISKGRSMLTLEGLRAALASDARLRVVAMNADVALETAAFAALTDFHARCVVATTSMLLVSNPNATLVTGDKGILKAGYVPTFWE